MGSRQGYVEKVFKLIYQPGIQTHLTLGAIRLCPFWTLEVYTLVFAKNALFTQPVTVETFYFHELSSVSRKSKVNTNYEDSVAPHLLFAPVLSCTWSLSNERVEDGGMFLMDTNTQTSAIHLHLQYSVMTCILVIYYNIHHWFQNTPTRILLNMMKFNVSLCSEIKKII